jgi:hypothetical protein
MPFQDLFRANCPLMQTSVLMMALQAKVVSDPEDPALHIRSRFARSKVSVQGEEYFLDHVLGVLDPEFERSQIPHQRIVEDIEEGLDFHR